MTAKPSLATSRAPMAIPIDTELEELGRSLSPKDIPAKLRCGICDLIAYNAIRLPCCSTNICEKCFKSELSDELDECILCHHSPLDKTICTPNKSMRVTVRAHLKNKLDTRLKREAVEAAKVVKEDDKIATQEVISQGPGAGKKVEENPHRTLGQIRESHATVVPEMEKSTTVPSSKSRELEQHHQEPHSNASDSNTAKIVEPVQQFDDDSKPQEAQTVNGEAHKEAQANQTQRGNQWGPPSQTNQDFSLGMSGLNGMLPMDMNTMIASGVMPMGGFQNMMGMGMMPQMMSQMFGGLDGSNIGVNMNGMNLNQMNMGTGMGSSAQGQHGGNWMAGQNSYINTYGGSGYGNQAGYNMSGSYSMNDQTYQNNDFQRGYGRQGHQNRRGRRGYYNGGSSRNSYNQAHQSHQYGFTNLHGNGTQPYQYQPHEQYSIAHAEITDTEQLAKGVSAEEAEAQMLKELAPGGEHDFDEELGRKPSIVEHVPNLPDREENADTSISSDSKETLPTEASVKETPLADDKSVEKFGSKEKPALDNKPCEENQPSTETPTALPTVPAVPQQEQAAQDVKGACDSRGSSPKPIQTFISDEPRVRNAMLPPRSNNSTTHPVEYSPDVGGYCRGDQAHVFNSHTASIVDSEGKGLGVVGAPTGPRALRQVQSNVSRDVRDPPEERPIAEVDKYDSHGHSPSRTPGNHRPGSTSRSRSRSPIRLHSDYHHNSRHHRSPIVTGEAERERWEEKREDKREERRHRRLHQHRRHKDEDYVASDTRRSSHHAHRRHGNDSEQSDRRRHRDRSRSRSPEHERDRDRTSERDKHRYEEHSSRKRRSHDRNEDVDFERLQRKRFRRESTTGYERQPTAYETSKPPTPVTPSFSRPSSDSRRSSTVVTAVAQIEPPVIKKPVPTGPRQAPSSTAASKPEKDIHTLEREARDRERLQREMQRRAFGASRKEGANKVHSGRRVSYKYEDEGGTDARRVEQEREAGRWA